MAEVTFRGLCEKHARLSASLTKAEVREEHMLCEVWKTFLQSRAQAAIEDSCSSNVLLGRRFLPGSAPGSALQRGPRSAITTHELLAQWLQVSICSAGTEEHHFITRDPQPMEKGKSTLALAAAAQAFLSSTGCFGVSEGVVCFHQVHDRGVAEKLKEFLSGHVRGIGRSGGEEASTEGCLRDDALGIADQQMHVGICAYRVSMTSIHMHLAQWLDAVLLPIGDGDGDAVGGRLLVRHAFLSREGALQTLMKDSNGIITFVIGLEAELAGILQSTSGQTSGAAGKRQQASAQSAGLQVPDGSRKDPPKGTPPDAKRCPIWATKEVQVRLYL
eukprot:254441-Amphidinium_carterae.1